VAIREVPEKALPFLGYLLRDASWKMQGYRNLFIKDGEVVAGKVGIMINLSDRRAHFNQHGQSLNVVVSGKLVIDQNKELTVLP
jgi:hypothetical protein